jgi:hypothetical protein
VVGGTSPGALRRAGTLGDGWMHHTDIKVSLYQGETNPGVDESDWQALADHLEVIRRHRAEAGREDRPFEVVAGMGTSIDALRRAEEAGVTTASVGPGVKNLRGTRDDFADWIKRFADEVIAKV